MMKVIIADYDEQRLNHLAGMLRAHFPGSVVTPLRTQPFAEGKPTDTVILEQLQGLAKANALLIGHIGGNPSGYQCLKLFKGSNLRGKVVLYTKMESIPLRQLAGLKLADRVFQRSPDDSQVFIDADEMMAVIKEVTDSPGVGYVRSRLKDPLFLTLGTATITLLGAVAKLIADLAK